MRGFWRRFAHGARLALNVCSRVGQGAQTRQQPRKELVMAWLSRAVLYGSLVSLSLQGCGDDANDANDSDESSATADDAGKEAPDGSGDIGTNFPRDAGPDASVIDLSASCELFCAAQSTCLGLSEADCMGTCMAQSEMLNALGCATEGTKENLCLAAISCEELMSYASGGRRAHALCGEEATAYFEACTPVERSECAELCTHQEACDVPGLKPGVCEEQCLLGAANLQWNGGETCAGAYLDFMGCAADANCEDVRAMVESGATPASCVPAQGAFTDACP
jgi:hypothetical protein